MEVVVVVVGIGIVCGAAAGMIQASSSSPDLDDPHLDPGRVRRAVVEHRAIRRLARLVPTRADVAMTEAVVAAGLVIVTVAAIVGITLFMIRADVGLARVDRPIARWAADAATDRSTEIMRWLTDFGGTAYVVAAAAIVAVVAWFRDRRAAVIVFVAVTMIGQFAVANAIKWSVDRARPSLSNLTGFAGTSFPSGHAVAASAAWACVAFLLGRGRSRRVRVVLAGAAVAIAVVVAGTRVGLGVHWTTDVVAGLAIGWSWFAVCALVFDGRRVRPARPLEVAHSEAIRSTRRIDR